MHFTSATAAIVTSFLLLGGSVSAVAVRSNSITKRAEPGQRCFENGQRVCNGAGDKELTCLGPPGADLFFAGTLDCIPGFQVCIGTRCVVDPERLKTKTTSVTEPEPTSTTSETEVPKATDGSGSGCGGFVGRI